MSRCFCFTEECVLIHANAASQPCSSSTTLNDQTQDRSGPWSGPRHCALRRGPRPARSAPDACHRAKPHTERPRLLCISGWTTGFRERRRRRGKARKEEKRLGREAQPRSPIRCWRGMGKPELHLEGRSVIMKRQATNQTSRSAGFFRVILT